MEASNCSSAMDKFGFTQCRLGRAGVLHDVKDLTFLTEVQPTQFGLTVLLSNESAGGAGHI